MKPGKATATNTAARPPGTPAPTIPRPNTLFWGTGNPAPDWNGDARKGDNLYSCSLLAVDADTGKMKWYFQFTPHETHDWDSSEPPVLFNATIDGKMRKLVALANRNAFYYVLDRDTGKFLAGVAVRKANLGEGTRRQRPPDRVARTISRPRRATSSIPASPDR